MSTLAHAFILIAPGIVVSLAAQNMQQGFLRGVVFGACIGLAYAYGRIRGGVR